MGRLFHGLGAVLDNAVTPKFFFLVLFLLSTLQMGRSDWRTTDDAAEGNGY